MEIILENRHFKGWDPGISAENTSTAFLLPNHKDKYDNFSHKRIDDSANFTFTFTCIWGGDLACI